MSRLSISASVVGAVLLVALAGTPARAQTFDKLTFMTFSGPVQIPGATLDAGTYRFHLANPDTGRNVLQVLSNDGVIVYSMFHTIPEVRTTATDEATVTFREVPVGVAPPVHALFYGGETNGYGFLYGRGEPNMIPNLTPQPPIALTPNPPTAWPVFEPEPAASPVMAAIAEPPVSEPVAALPVTASPLPIFGFAGASLLVLGLGVGLLRRHGA